MAGPTIRPCEDRDIPAITAIYAHWVAHGTASFEETAPSEAQMAGRRAQVIAERMPYLVAELDGSVVGLAYATVYRTRSAYRFTAEDSVYVHHAHGNGGVGRALLAALISECEAIGCRQMIAVISDDESEGSVRLHRRFGFTPAGELKSVGYKFGRWINTVRMQRTLGPGDSKPPVERA
ncbi:MAG: GNAT family N-acetyltransferase [Gemmatimonadetes bacterium]|nr:GNAT family N-acetyltransferase [Gemmatimonadota bacterium]